MSISDIILTPLYLLLLFVVSFIFQELRYKNDGCKNYFVLGFVLKMIGVLAFVAIYKLYYKSGDTIFYFYNSSILWNLLVSSPSEGWEVLTANANHFDIGTLDYTRQMDLYAKESTFMVVRIAAVLGLFCFNNFYIVSILFCFFSFLGLWALYRVMIDLYPQLKLQFFAAIFMLPSVVFWGGGIMKDSLVLGGMGLVIYGFYHLFIKKDQFILPIILIPASAYLIVTIKFYIIMALIPALFFWWVGYHYSLTKIDLRFRAFVVMVIVVVLGVFLYFTNDKLFGLTEILVANFIRKAMDFQIWHSYLGNTQGGSSYDLGEMDFSLGGIISKIPASLNVTFFRPYLFEANSPVMLVSAIESLGFLVLTLYVWVRVGIIKTFQLIFTNHIIFAFLIFACLFGFIVGFTSYNFGSLVRYKIPCMPFYIIVMFILLKMRKNN